MKLASISTAVPKTPTTGSISMPCPRASSTTSKQSVVSTPIKLSQKESSAYSSNSPKSSKSSAEVSLVQMTLVVHRVPHSTVLAMAVMRVAIRLLTDQEAMAAGVRGVAHRKEELRPMALPLMARVGRRDVGLDKEEKRCTTIAWSGVSKRVAIMKLRASSIPLQIGQRGSLERTIFFT